MKKRIVVWMTFKGWLKITLSFMAVIFLLMVFSYDMPTNRAVDPWSLPLNGRVIALDAGHGGPDPGAVGSNGLTEKEVTLQIALHLRDYLQQAGAIVVMTREEDEDLASEQTKGFSRRKTEDLINRAKLVKSSDSELLVTIHLNSIPSPRWYGAQSFYKIGSKDSEKLAYFIQDEIIRNLENTYRVAKPIRNIYLLEASEIPAALVEVGFLSNAKEAGLLQSKKYQKQMAASIYNGILRYYSGEELPSKE